MTRREKILIGSLVLLVAGAGINIVVAWVLLGAPTSYAPATTESGLSSDQAARTTARMGAPEGWPIVTQRYVIRTFGWKAVGAAAAPRRVVLWGGVRIEGGWPARSMVFVRLTVFDPQLRTTSGSYGEELDSLSIEPPWYIVPNSRWFRDCDRLPLTPIPAGFLINTLFYALVAALPLAFFPLRRYRRVCGGRCGQCGYDLRGATSLQCPECGALVGRRVPAAGAEAAPNEPDAASDEHGEEARSQ